MNPVIPDSHLKEQCVGTLEAQEQKQRWSCTGRRGEGRTVGPVLMGRHCCGAPGTLPTSSPLQGTAYQPEGQIGGTAFFQGTFMPPDCHSPGVSLAWGHLVAVAVLLR